jgi:hypothetical protein
MMLTRNKHILYSTFVDIHIAEKLNRTEVFMFSFLFITKKQKYFYYTGYLVIKVYSNINRTVKGYSTGNLPENLAAIAPPPI